MKIIKTIGQQGEVRIDLMDGLPEGVALTKHTERNHAGLPIISHSESGHHHVLDRDDVEVFEQKEDVPAGMRILYAILENPETALVQDAATPHEPMSLKGDGKRVVRFTISREYDPFSEQARKVAD